MLLHTVLPTGSTWVAVWGPAAAADENLLVLGNFPGINTVRPVQTSSQCKLIQGADTLIIKLLEDSLSFVEEVAFG